MASQPPDWLARIRPETHLVGHGLWSPGTAEPSRYLLDHELVAFSRGTCRVTVDGQAYECPPETFMIIPPGLAHATVAVRGQVHRYWAHFDWLRSKDAAPTAIFVYAPNQPRTRDLHPAPAFVPQGPLHGLARQFARVRSLFQTLCIRWEAGETVERATCDAVLLELLLRLLAPTEPNPRFDRRRALAFEIKRQLDACSFRPVSVQKQLEAMGFSYAHLSRTFRAAFGISPIRYLNAQRIERSKLLLEDPRLSIAQVAFECGFDDPAYFGRVFRQMVGVSPSRYADCTVRSSSVS